MKQLEHFQNDGSGWVCLRCLADLPNAGGVRKSMFAEGEAENKFTDLGNRALARWADDSRQILVCPRCGTTEKVGQE